LQAGGQALVRINAVGTPEFAEDLAMVVAAQPQGIVLPKADAVGLAAVRARLHAAQSLIALVESVAGVIALRDIAATPGLSRLAFGSIDFGLDAGIPGTGHELDFVRSRLVIESRFAGLPAPIDGVTPVIDQPEVITREAERSRRFGFGGKLCIHPAQVALVNTAFAPTAAEVGWAEQVVAAASQRAGDAFLLAGQMIDRPVVARAHAVLAARDARAAIQRA
jgi:citrate lyase subunit beta/citryl-CoA lyase